MTKVLVANRGEIAVRIMRATREVGWTAVAVHAADEVAAQHLSLADQTVELPGAGAAAFLDIDAIVTAALSTGCTMVHPGYGFLSENAGLARQCAKAGLTFVGPAPHVLDLFGDKSSARQFAGEQSVPVLPGTSHRTSLAEALEFGAEHGALMVKAISGGGGRGMRAVVDLDQLERSYRDASQEALKAFGDGGVYVEKLVVDPRHIEVQVLGDGSGDVVVLGERDCSIQRRHQKLVEVAPSPWISEALRGELLDAAGRLARSVDYEGLGTFEFLVEADDFYFMEANPRLQVEHTVTEEVTGIDLVAAQLRIAAGASLDDLGVASPPSPRGVAIQMRVNAESITVDGAPVPTSGVLRRFDPPTGPGVRVDTHVHAGYTISPRYDSLVAKVIVHGSDLVHATVRSAVALESMVIDGVGTNVDLLHGIVSSVPFAQGPWDTGFIPSQLQALLSHRRPAGQAEGPTDETSHDGKGPAVPEGSLVVTATMPGVVIEILGEAGATVPAGTGLVVIEAMKIEHPVKTAVPMRLEMIVVTVGDVVDAGSVLAFGLPVDELEDAPAVESRAVGGDDWSPEVDELRRRREMAARMGGPDKVARQHDAGKLDARERVEAFLDAGTFAEIGALTGFSTDDGEVTPANFVAGTGKVDGRKIVLGVDDFTIRAGSGDAAIHAKQVFAERYAGEMRLPVVRLLDGASGGGSVKMATDAGYMYVPVNPAWDVIVGNLSLVPVVTAALGPTVGLGAARMVMSHFGVMVESAQMFTAGPPVVLASTGERLTKEELGGPSVHRHNGTIERVVADEATAFATIRTFLSYLPGNAFALPPVVETSDPADRRDERLLGALPRSARVPYDVEEILASVFDAGSVFRYADYGGGTVTALARLDGHPVGVIAADPLLGATMSVEGALAVTRLVDLCETFHLPVVSLTDQAGITIGSEAERAGTIRHGARAIAAVYQARTPQAEIILRRVYGVGGAGIVNRHRAGRSWSWPSGDWGSLPSKGGIEAAFRAQIAAADDPAAELARLTATLEAVSSPFRTAERFGVQDIIDPRDSRPLLCDWVRDAYRVLPELLGPPAFGTRP